MSEASGQVRISRQSSPEQQATEYAVLAEISRIISSTLNIDEIYEQFAHQVSLLISLLIVSRLRPSIWKRTPSKPFTRWVGTYRAGNGV